MTSTISDSVMRNGARNGLRRRLRDSLACSRTAGDKLRVPQPSVSLLQRPRVTELIEQAAGHRVTMVCGPAGAGKTVACALWAAAAPAAGSVAWLSLDPGDRRPGRLWKHVSAALAGADSVPDDLVGDLPDACDDAFALRLVEMAERLSTPVTLIIDDVQELAGSEILPGLDLVVRHGPPTLRLLLSCRHPAGLQVAKLRVGGDLAEIGPRDLACTADEADDYFAMLGVDLPAAQRDELLARTEGWMTGLRLAAMRAAPGNSAAAVCRITGDEPMVADYLWDEVLATLAADRRVFLLRTSVADRICGDLADALTAGNDGTAMLDELCRENVMVRPAADDHAPPSGNGSGTGSGTGSGETEYRYHPLLLDLLRAQLRRELPGEVPLLARRAARWQAAHGLHAEAIRNAAQANDWDLAARVLAEAGPSLLLPGPAAELEPLLAAFPASRYVSDAAVAGALAAAGVRTGDCCAAMLHLDNAEQALDRCPPAQRRPLAAWLQALRLMIATARGTADADLIGQSMTLVSNSEASASGTAEHQALGLLWSALGVAALGCMRVAAARDALAQACRHLRHSGHREFYGQASGWHAIAEAMYGDLLAAHELTADPAEDATGTSTTGATGTGASRGDPLSARLADLATAYLHWARDDLAAARGLLDQCEHDDSGGRTGGLVIGSLVTVARARLALCEGDQAAARTLLTRLRYRNLGQGTPSGTALDPALAPLDAEIARRDGNLNRARLALRRAGDLQQADRADLLLAHARVLLDDGDSKGALAKAERCLDGTASQLTLHDQISALIVASIAHRRLGQAEQAADQMTCALALAEPHRMYRPFLDGGSAARSAMTVLIRPASQGAALAARILQRFDACPGRPADQPAASIPLTGSELAVLRFLPSHMTNQEIAEALFLSINTVKTHLRSVYRKLGVSTRRQAISRGGRLGLL